MNRINCVDSINNTPATISPFYSKLREDDIKDAFMVCYHYRVFSKQSIERKCLNNKLENYQPRFMQHLLDSDHADIVEEFMKRKSILWFGHIN